MATLEVQSSAAQVEGGASGQRQAILDVEIVVVGRQITADGDAIQRAVAVQRRDIAADDGAVLDRAVDERGQATDLEQSCRADVQRRAAQVQRPGNVDNAAGATRVARGQHRRRHVAAKIRRARVQRDGAQVGPGAGVGGRQGQRARTVVDDDAAGAVSEIDRVDIEIATGGLQLPFVGEVGVVDDEVLAGDVGVDDAVVDEAAVAEIVVEAAVAAVRQTRAQCQRVTGRAQVDIGGVTRALQCRRATGARH